MTQDNKTICPVCGREILLVVRPDDPSKLVANCDCGGSYKSRGVVEMDNPNFVSEQDRLEPGEPRPPKSFKRR